MSNASLNAYMMATQTGLLKGYDDKILKFIECMGATTWQDLQVQIETIEGRRLKDSLFSSGVARLNKDGKLKIVKEIEGSNGYKRSVYDLVER